MQSTSTSVAAAASTWGATAKTVALGAAGTALWGSLAFYFAVGLDGAESVINNDTDKTVERLFFRTELPEVDLVRGCQLNHGAGDCDGKAWIILSQYKPKAEAPPMPTSLQAAVPQPLWDNVTERVAMSDAACAKAITQGLPQWLATVPRSPAGASVALVPDHLASCQAIAPGIDPKREHRSFWFISGDKVVAELRCSLPDTYMDPSCELGAYPEHGEYEVSYSRLPAANVQAIADQAPNMLEVLEDALPSEIATQIDLDFIKGPITRDDAVDGSMAALMNVSY